MVTMKEIAAHVGVSQPTVSVVLNNKSSIVRISTVTRKRIEDAAKELGYHRNAIARSMVTGRTNFIGYLNINISSEFATRILDGIMRECDQRDFFVKIFPFYQDANFEAVASRMFEQRPAGLICRSITKEMMDYLKVEARKLNIPVAFTGSTFPSDWGIRVGTVDREGVFAGVNHLLEKGHKRIAVVNLDYRRAFTRFRQDYFLEAMQNAGLKVPDQYLVTLSRDQGQTEERVKQLMELPEPPTALFCIAGDAIAAQALRALRKKNLRVPEDVSVMGYSGITISRFVDPPLTTIFEPFEEIGRTAAKQLIDEICRTERISLIKEQKIEIPSQLVIGEST
jgi:DNA-binding LacI/PurR family transcriptional regulator